ncbi:MAG: hypothetical protein PV354_01045, partial [Bartonella sp.]|nr:hypothetical protein [Bartonella sp.]
MIDFVGILKNTINEQKNITPKLRKQIYERATKTLEYKIVNMTLPKEAIEAQRRALQSAITTVEEEYLAVEKEKLSSIIGWNCTDENSGEKNEQSSLSSLENDVSVLAIEKQQKLSITNLVDNEIFDEASVTSDIPDAELVKLDAFNAHEKDQNIKKDMSNNDLLVSTSQVDNSHSVSH